MNARWTRVDELFYDGRHNAWPDICRWRERYYVAFNASGVSHGGGHGLSLLESVDGERWEQVLATGQDEWPGGDAVRGGTCPKLLPTPDGLLIFFNYYAAGEPIAEAQREQLWREWSALGGGEALFGHWLSHHDTSFVTGCVRTNDGRAFSEVFPVLDRGWRVWRPHTRAGTHYIIGYRCHGQDREITWQLAAMATQPDIEMFESASLFSSADGLEWSKVSDIAADDNDEADFDFTEDGRILMVSRTGASLKPERPAMAYRSAPPYATWLPLTLSEPVHAPALRRFNGRWILAGRGSVAGTAVPSRFAPDREVDQYAATRLWELNEGTGDLIPLSTLPSWGDGSYPGMVPGPDGDLWVVYYSCSHTVDDNLLMGPGPLPGKTAPTAIYLARLRLKD
mgnify:CR=1 FL=1